MGSSIGLVVRNVLFTVVVPGTGGVLLPWWILTRGGAVPTPTAPAAVVPIGVGTASPAASRAFDAGFTRMRDQFDGVPEERYLVHSDLLHWNVLVADDRLTGLLDWGSSIFGDFMYDIAWLTFWSPWYPQWSGLGFASAAREHYTAIGLDVPRFEERLRCCELRIGLGSLVWYSSRNDTTNLERAADRIQELTR